MLCGVMFLYLSSKNTKIGVKASDAALLLFFSVHKYLILSFLLQKWSRPTLVLDS